MLVSFRPNLHAEGDGDVKYETETVAIGCGGNHSMRVDDAGTLAPDYLELVASWVLNRRN